MNPMRTLPLLALAALAAVAPAPGRAIDQAQTDAVIRAIDEMERSGGDYKALAYIEAKEKDKTDVVYELVYYRRSEGQRLLILFTRPKSEAGKGYLRLEKNLWLYDPATGKWERRTERERIGGTDSRREDFDEPRLAEEYRATFEATEKLGAFTAHKVKLEARDGVDVAYPVVRLWIDAASDNVLKRQEFALSGRLMRTALYPRWKKVYSESKKADVWYPEEIRIYDEIEKGNSTLILIKEIDLRPLEANLFTKAWLESRSR